MAERSGPSRILPCILVGLGAFLLAIAILIPTYTVGKLEKTPLDLEVTTVATGTGSVLNSAALLGGKAQVDTNVPIVAQRYVTTQDPSDADIITVEAGQTVRRTDKQGDTGLLTATLDRVTLDRVSHGRAGWNMVTGFSIDEARNFGLDAVAPVGGHG